MVRIAYDSPFTKLSTPATIAAAAERCPPPVSEEMMRIFGPLGFISLWHRLHSVFPLNNHRLKSVPLTVRVHRDSVRLLIDPGRHIARRLFHLALQLLDPDQMLRVERQRRVITVGLMRAEATIRRVLTTLLHCRRKPESLEIPFVIAEISDRRQVLARRQSAFIVNHRAGRAGVAS